jgi:hypothetical protein
MTRQDSWRSSCPRLTNSGIFCHRDDGTLGRSQRVMTHDDVVRQPSRRQAFSRRRNSAAGGTDELPVQIYQTAARGSRSLPGVIMKLTVTAARRERGVVLDNYQQSQESRGRVSLSHRADGHHNAAWGVDVVLHLLAPSHHMRGHHPRARHSRTCRSQAPRTQRRSAAEKRGQIIAALLNVRGSSTVA